MGDDQRRPVAGNPLQRVLYFLLGPGVECGGRLVEYQDARILQDRACDRDTRLFTARKFQTALAHLGLVAFGCDADEAVKLRMPRGIFKLGIGCRPAAVTAVVTYGVVEQYAVLRHDS